jgi:hypothetical protein
MDTPIIVLGMHRSGTSLLAEAVHRWGAYAGYGKDLLEAGKSNARGFWEFEPLVSFNKLLLTSLDSDWCLPPPQEAEPMLVRRAAEAWFRTRAAYLISRMQAAGKPWFWKDPRLCILLPFWKQFLNPVYVVTVRRPSETALSLYKRNGMPTSAGLLLWQYYMLSLIRHTRRARRIIFVQYDALVSGSEQEFVRLRDFLDTHCGGAGPSSNLSESADSSADRLQKMMSVAEPELNHNGRDVTTACCPLTRDQLRLQNFLEMRVTSPDAKSGLRGCELYPGWREYLAVCYTLRTMPLLSRDLEGMFDSEFSTDVNFPA